MKALFNLILVVALAVATAQAQDEVPPPMPAAPTLSDAQLDQLLGPIALYPDPLIAVMLPAATQPAEIVVADRYIQGGGDPNAIDQQPWDPNVQALAHYPDVLKWMDDNLTWTTQLGQAFLNQQQDVMDSVQRLRTEAYNLGNLVSTPQQQVIDDGGYIEIIPVSPDDVYVPDYQPQQVYYDAPSGPPYIVFSIGYVIGPWLCCDFDWHHRHLIYWDQSHPRPSNWWHESPAYRAAYVAKQTTIPVWHPQIHGSYSSGYQGDRGYNQNNQNQRAWRAPTVNSPAPTLSGHPQPTLSGHPQPTLNEQRNVPDNVTYQQNRYVNPPVVNRPTPAPPVERYQPQNQRPENNAFIGIQSAQDTRDYSQRGQQSTEEPPRQEAPPPRQEAPPPSPPPQPPPEVHSGGGGGGGGNNHR
jgi:hypothetical protein